MQRKRKVCHILRNKSNQQKIPLKDADVRLGRYEATVLENPYQRRNF